MCIATITLEPYNSPTWAVNCYEQRPDFSATTALERRPQTTNVLISDFTYRINLETDILEDMENIFCYINGKLEPSYLEGTQLRFRKGRYEQRIFLDCYGFVEISLCIEYKNYIRKWLYSDYIPVLVRKGRQELQVRSMAEFVYRNYAEFLYHGSAKAKDTAQLTDGFNQSMDAQLLLMDQIITQYEQLFSYFKTNARYKTVMVNRVDRVETLKYVNPATLQYMVCHPQELWQTSGTSGVRVGRRNYHPERTLVSQYEQSCDIYENRVLLSFLVSVIQKVEQLAEEARGYINRNTICDEEFDPYIYSPTYLFAPVLSALEVAEQHYRKGIEQLQTLYSMYQSIFGFSKTKQLRQESPVGVCPRFTAIFSNVPQYHRIYMAMYQWVHYGDYHLEGERYMLSFTGVSTLYERYLAIKFILYLKESGWKQQMRLLHEYESTSNNWNYQNTKFFNTFQFSEEDVQITFYYQPVIYCSEPSDDNGIGLYRNTTVSLELPQDEKPSNRSYGSLKRGQYYSPDFLIKYQDEESRRYLICDGKFSKLETIYKYQLSSLIYKYLFSIAPKSSQDSYMGMCIFCGKCDTEDRMHSVYDKQRGYHKIHPYAHLVPMMVDIEEKNHKLYFDEVLNMLR